MSLPDPRLRPVDHLIPAALDQRLSELWDGGFFAVDGRDLAFLNMCLAACRPDVVVEIGTATGISTAALAVMQAQVLGAPGHLRTYDLRDRLWFDEEREVGCMIGTVLGEDPMQVGPSIASVTGGISADVALHLEAGSVDFAFVDANHQHPWPILDTLMLLPLMRAGALIAHHDLQLYLDPANNVGQGPKILFDQLAENNRFTARTAGCAPYVGRTRVREVRENIFALQVPDDITALAQELSRGLALPWTLARPMTQEHADQIRTRLVAFYPADVARWFDLGLARDRHRRAISAPPPVPRGPLARVMRKFRG